MLVDCARHLYSIKLHERPAAQEHIYVRRVGHTVVNRQCDLRFPLMRQLCRALPVCVCACVFVCVCVCVCACVVVATSAVHS